MSVDVALVAGATGQVGRRIVARALEAGFAVRAFVRDPAGLALQHPRLSLARGNVTDAAAVDQAIAGVDVVFSALGARPGDPATIRADGVRQILAAMRTHGVQRVLAIGGAGILQETAERMRRDNPDYPSFLVTVSNDHLQVFRLLEQSDTNWTLVCPPTIVNAEGNGSYRTQADYAPEGAMPEINAGDLAAFLVDEATACRFVRHRVGIGQIPT
jgi:putative NADH-flavin reductase